MRKPEDFVRKHKAEVPCTEGAALHRRCLALRLCVSVCLRRRPRCERRSHFSPNCRSCSLVLRHQLTLVSSPSILRHHAYAWWPHRRHFANNLRCWATLRGTFGETPSVLRHQLTHGGLTMYTPCFPHILSCDIFH